MPTLWYHLGMNSFVYVIGVSDNPVKIGYADRVETRLIALQIGNPEELQIFGRVAVPWAMAKAIEAKTHAILRERHRRGEWFNVSADQALAAIAKARAIVAASNDNIKRQEGILSELLGGHELHPWASHAVQAYHATINALGRSKDAEEMERVMAASEGSAAVLALRTLLTQRTKLVTLYHRDRTAYNNACMAAVSAVNALSIWYAERAEAQLLDKISGNAA